MDQETNKLADAAYIATHPELFGFTWVYRDLNKGRDQKTLLRANVPQIEVSEESFTLFLASFPKTVLAAINGTSAKIRGQNVARPFIRANPKATNAAIAEHIVRSVMLNQIVRTGGSRNVYVGTDGKSYATLAEAQAASGQPNAKARPTPVELAQAFISDAVDMGVPFNVAREKALAKWPEAFVVESPNGDDDDDDDANEGDVPETDDEVDAIIDGR